MNATTETTPSNMSDAASMETAKAVTPPAIGSSSGSAMRPSGEVMTVFRVPTLGGVSRSITQKENFTESAKGEGQFRNLQKKGVCYGQFVQSV